MESITFNNSLISWYSSYIKQHLMFYTWYLEQFPWTAHTLLVPMFNLNPESRAQTRRREFQRESIEAKATESRHISTIIFFRRFSSIASSDRHHQGRHVLPQR